ncbi:hypothetical protein Moror_14929, partial [Moniliophthora roreri MCA 2997]
MAADDPYDLLDEFPNAMRYMDLQHSTGLRFVIPFPMVDALWTHEGAYVRAKSLKLLSLFKQSWKPCPKYDGARHHYERTTFMQHLADHINRDHRVSALLTSKRGQALLRFIHNEAIIRHWVSNGDGWHQAIKRAQEVGGLPSDYFAPILENPWDPPPALPTLEPIRCSIDTEDLDIVTSSAMEDSSGADPTEGGLVRRLHNFGAWLVSRRRPSFFQRNERVTCNDIGSSGSIVPDRELGVDGAEQSTDNLEDRATALGDTSGQGGGDNYSLHSLNQRASD